MTPIYREGNMPVEMVRLAVNGQKVSRDYQASWKFYGRCDRRYVINSPVITVTACPPSLTDAFDPHLHHTSALRRLVGQELRLPSRPAQ